MVVYLIIGIIVGIVETIMAYVDAKNMGLKLDDINPKASHQNKALQVFVMISTPIAIAIVWPYQVYVWIRRIVKHYTV